LTVAEIVGVIRWLYQLPPYPRMTEGSFAPNHGRDHASLDQSISAQLTADYCDKATLEQVISGQRVRSYIIEITI
jgi:hypothetical protein